MNTFLFPFLAVIVGASTLWLGKWINKKFLPLLLSFSGALLLSLIVFELLPTIYKDADSNIGLWILTGILLQLVLESLSKGAEHGHLHVHGTNRLPLTLLISLSIHSIVEGFSLGQFSGLTIGVSIHKLPITIVIALFLAKSTIKKGWSFLLLILFGLMTPLGSYLSLFVKNDSAIQIAANAMVVGVLLHVSTTILFESNSNHKLKINNLIAIVSAFVIGYFL
jgi:zinc transporter ZupT